MSRTAVITGGTRGIGRACAQRFYDMGYNVAMIYAHDDESAHSIARLFDEKSSLIVRADVADVAAVKSAAGEILSKFGGVDVLINNAGIARQMMMNDITPADWDRMFSVNVKGAFNCTKAFMDSMIHKKFGRIINISSMWGVTGASCEVHYSASKAALIGFTKALAKELGPSGITVNCIAPGLIDTDMNASLDRETIDELVAETPMMRIGTGEDVAAAAAYFASDGAGFVTGQVLGVNGGFVV